MSQDDGSGVVLLPEFPAAAQPDIVMAAQKDDYWRRHVAELLTKAAESLVGANMSAVLRQELTLVADLLFFCALSLRGHQTLGEEYTDIFQVSAGSTDGQSLFRLPSRRRRALLLLTSVLVPYLIGRLYSGGFRPLLSAFRRQPTARERAEAMRAAMRLRAAEEENTRGGGVDVAEPSSLDALRNRAAAALRRLSQLLPSRDLAQRFHLGLFYLEGVYYDWPKRLSGVRYAFTREPVSNRPSYAVLGVFIYLQLGLELVGSVASVVRRLASNLRARMQRQKLGDEAAELQVTSDERVASLVEDPLSPLRKQPNAGSCGICLDAMTTPACTPCGHLYCYACIVEACCAKPECPLCRTAVLPQQIIPVYFGLSTD